jgi:hypothetical protein
LATEGIAHSRRRNHGKDLNAQLNAPSFTASALKGDNVIPTVKKAISKTLVAIREKLLIGGTAVDKKANDTFAFDLENRLDDFFSDSLPSQDEPPMDASPAPNTDLPLKDLKSTILAIDWEITDDALDAFIGQFDGFSEQFEADKVVHTFLKLVKINGKIYPLAQVQSSSGHHQANHGGLFCPGRNQLPTMI